MEPTLREFGPKARATVFGVANHSPEELVSKLLASRIADKPATIGIVPPTAKADVGFPFLLMLSTSDFTRNLMRLHDTNCKTFVFANPIDLSEFMGVRHLDFVRVDDFSFRYGELDLSGVPNSTPKTISRTESDFLNRLTHNVKQGSLLNPLMTFVYSLSSPNQNLVKISAVRYLSGIYSLKKLKSLLADHLTERASEKLISILSTSSALVYGTVLSQIQSLKRSKQSFDLDKLAKLTGTSSYELSYMLSVLDDKTSFSDSFDKAKNRKL